MRKQLFLLIMLSIFTINLSAQFWYDRYYPNKTLSELNSTELSFLYDKSVKTANTGLVLVAVGTGVTVIGSTIMIGKISQDIITWDYSGDAGYNSVGVLILLGSAAAIIGIPTWIIGVSRKKTIRRTMNGRGYNSMLQVSPFIQYNNIMQSYNNGLSVTLRF